MTTLAERFASQAERFDGVPFRLQGRDPATGLDCIGLAACALERAGASPRAPEGYSLRNTCIAEQLRCAARSGLQNAQGKIERGDILLVSPGPAQHHVLIALGQERFIHAHAGLRRVVIQRGLSGWPILEHWRLAAR